MLSKHIVHFKNVLFIKILLYTALYGGAFFIIPQLQQHYIKTKSFISSYKRKIQSLNEKVSFIKDKEFLLPQGAQLLKKIQSTPSNQSCIQHTRIVKKIKLFNADHNLSKKIKLTAGSSEIFYDLHKMQHANLRTQNVNFSYATADFKHFNQIAQKIHTILPQYTMFHELHAKKTDVINPQNILYLTNGMQPGLTAGYINFWARALRVTK